MEVDPAVSMRTLRAEYRAAWASSDAAVASLGASGGEIVVDGKPVDPRVVVLTVISETARHAGHADIIREQIDGRVGR